MALAVLASVVVAGAGLPAPVGAGAAGPGPAVSDQWEIAVFLCTPSSPDCRKRGATEKQKRAVRTILEGLPEVTAVRFVDRATAYASFRQDFAGKKTLLAKVRAKDVPESFHVQVTQGADRGRVRVAVARRPGVGTVVDQAEMHALEQDELASPDVGVYLCTKVSAMPACGSGRGAANGKKTTSKEKKAVVAAIKGTPGVESYSFVDQTTAYQNFVETFADHESLVAVTKVSDIPELYSLTMRSEADWGAAARRLERLSGVSTVYNARCFQTTVKLTGEYGLSHADPENTVC
ncbi:permease-like cell division protein FtsX [Nonomuraea rosea]|uniref:permease-like cell division protein FtsX n=1 Tax=Nonomuraea rosea TaxID=638574 RepID=UPI0031ED4425